jgi:hypothetical protein
MPIKSRVCIFINNILFYSVNQRESSNIFILIILQTLLLLIIQKNKPNDLYIFNEDFY